MKKLCSIVSMWFIFKPPQTQHIYIPLCFTSSTQSTVLTQKAPLIAEYLRLTHL